MYRILQTALAEFPYMLEKYLIVMSMLPTIIFIAAAYTAVLAIVYLCVGAICRRKRGSVSACSVLPWHGPFPSQGTP